MLLTIQQTIWYSTPQDCSTSDCCQKLESHGIWFRNRLHNATKCATKVAAAHKTGKLHCYRIQQYYLCSNKISLNFSETIPPPLLLLLSITITTTTTIIIIIIIINGNKMYTNVIEHQKRDQENEHTDFGKVENNKHPSVEGEQPTVKKKLKEDLQIMWNKVRLLQMCEREKLPKLKMNKKLIRLQEEINGVIEELLEEDEMNITNINNLIYAAATIMTQTLNEPSKRSKNRTDVKFWKIRM